MLLDLADSFLMFIAIFKQGIELFIHAGGTLKKGN